MTECTKNNSAAQTGDSAMQTSNLQSYHVELLEELRLANAECRALSDALTDLDRRFAAAADCLLDRINRLESELTGVIRTEISYSLERLEAYLDARIERKLSCIGQRLDALEMRGKDTHP